ncbi:MAG TPA: SpoIIE family protein phosphatase [Terriglobia bacterium]|jgi:sigma-B regulation protein RsbU (phosphoserine phosphatase)|nr:SpoIIE family protein phosphatase [Terriglobia bacterium]
MKALTEEIVSGADTKPPRLLIADDQPAVLDALRLLLKQEGYEIEAANSPAGVLASLEHGPFDALLMDLNYARDTTSGEEGLDLVARVQEIDRTLPIVVMTAWSSVPVAVEAMRRGVRDFVEKPWNNDAVVRTLHQQVSNAREERRQRLLFEQEMALARETERGLLPREVPQMPGYEIRGAWQPALTLGGDYFDARRLEDGLLALSIADVSGKGTSAALLVSNLQAAVRASSRADVPPCELCHGVNKLMRSNLGQDRFVTFFYALLDAPARRLTYCNAGHNAPILVRASGSVERLHRGGMVLGLAVEGRYEQDEVQLDPGDRLLLFTDGLTEANNAAGEEFGEDRLIEIAVRYRELSAEALEEKVLGSAAAFTSGFTDDVTLVVVAATDDSRLPMGN